MGVIGKNENTSTLADLSVLTEGEVALSLIMKDGKIYRNILQ